MFLQRISQMLWPISICLFKLFIAFEISEVTDLDVAGVYVFLKEVLCLLLAALRASAIIATVD